MDVITGFGGSAATETGKYLLPKIIKHIGYLFKYKENLASLKVARDKLDAKGTDARGFAEQTDRKIQDISSSTSVWMSEADQLHQKAEKIISRYNVSCLNLWSRYSLSKQAWKLTHEINEKVKTAPDFGTAFDRPAPGLGAIFNLRGFMEFDSRLTVMNSIYEALKDEEVSMCSVCGMGGIGKTTLVKKLIKKVEADNLFDKVAMVTVSQNVNLQAIQDQIIEQLGLKVDEKTATARANKLNAWLTSKRILLVLDDVWRQLSDEEFEQIGIPLESKGCKIVLTSRNEDECKKMGSQKTFPIKVLEDGEAWELFQLYAGECVEDLNIQNTARKIADECDGLPIAIVTIATALKDKPKGVWNDSLLQLQNSNLQGISGMDKVYSRIQLSYDLLKDEKTQSFFRLCCLYPEDFDVPVEDLVLYGKGLELFENVDTMAKARDRVESIIHKLKKSFLLLDSEDDGCVKMHDIVCDFVISISSKDKHPYLVGHGNEMTKWPETTQYENYSVISFMFDIIKEHPVDLRCPKLKLLALSFEEGSAGFPIGFFEGMEELKVLVLKVPSLWQSLCVQKKLRTLILEESSWFEEEIEPPKVGELIGHGDLKNVEIFIFSSRRPCNDFPMEIGVMCNLRLLNFKKAPFEYMPPGVLSKLVKLEELQLPLKFNRWGCKEGGGERVNASLKEIKSLPLTILQISVKEGSFLGEKLVKDLKGFEILIASNFDLADDLLQIAREIELGMGKTKALMRKSKRLKLIGLRNLKNLNFLQQTAEDNECPQLKNIETDSCDETKAEHTLYSFFSQLEILELYWISCMEAIWHGPYFSKMQPPCFSNLSRIVIFCCPKLKHMFPLPVAKELRQLQFLQIYDCFEMEKIFYKEHVDERNEVASSVQLSTTPTTSIPTLNNPIEKKPQLISPTVPNITSSHQIVEENIAKDDGKEVDHAIIIIFPQLKQLKLFYIPKLRIFYDGNEAIELPSLQELFISYCDNMEGLSYGSLIAPKLKEIEINRKRYQNWEDVNAIVKEKVRHYD